VLEISSAIVSRPTDALVDGTAYDKEYFTAMSTWSSHSTQHNAAAKCFRDWCVREGLGGRRLPAEPLMLAGIWHQEKASTFELNADVLWAWSWLELVGQLNAESLDIVFGTASFVTGCTFAFRETPKTATGMHVWDFIIHRSDGSAIGLHPEWKSLKIPSCQLQAPPSDEELQELKPMWSGPTKPVFCLYRRWLGKETLRFDHARSNGKHPYRATDRFVEPSGDVGGGAEASQATSSSDPRS
jgi:hypothetical protein